MKQGRASSSTYNPTNYTPKSSGVNPGAVADMGVRPGRPNQTELYPSHGYKASIANGSILPHGSQGKHK